SGELVIARCASAEMLELAEESLDRIAPPVELGVDRALPFAMALGGDVGLSAPSSDQVDQMLPVIAAIGDEDRGRQPFEQYGRSSLVGGLARGQGKPDRPSALVDDRVDLAAQSSTRTADGVIRAPFLPPPACWWARTMEESISCSDCGEAAASASKIRSHTPALAQRL